MGVGGQAMGPPSILPLPVGISAVKEITSAFMGTFFLKTDGSLWGCGANYNDQPGDGTTESRLTPVLIMSEGVAKVAAGYFHVLILKTDGSLWVCGDNGSGQLSMDYHVSNTAPVMISATGVLDFVSGVTYMIMLKPQPENIFSQKAVVPVTLGPGEKYTLDVSFNNTIDRRKVHCQSAH